MPYAPSGQVYVSAPPYETPPQLPAKNNWKVKAVVAVVVVYLCAAVILAIIAHNSHGAGVALSPAAWRDGGGQDLVQRLNADFVEIYNAGNQGDDADMNTACRQLRTDVQAAQAYKEIPDQQAQTAWAQALASFAAGATDCMEGTDPSDPVLLKKAAYEMALGTAQLLRCASRMQELSALVKTPASPSP